MNIFKLYIIYIYRERKHRLITNNPELINQPGSTGHGLFLFQSKFLGKQLLNRILPPFMLLSQQGHALQRLLR